MDIIFETFYALLIIATASQIAAVFAGAKYSGMISVLCGLCASSCILNAFVRLTSTLR